MRADYHIHSNFSVDSKVLMEEYIKKAIEDGLDEICFTDHVDYDVVNDFTSSQTVNYEEFFSEFARYKEEYKDKISLKAGMEFGVQLHTIDKYNKDFEAYPFDFIILSSHEIDNKEFWLYQYQKEKNQLEYNIGYYENLIKLVENYDNFSVLGHLDVIKRYDKAGILDDSIVLDYIKKLLAIVIKKNKGIEINTSSFRYKMNNLTPSKEILKLYRDLGGKIITLGSDSHDVSHLGECFDVVKDELRELGFTHFCTFEKMNPIFHEL